MESGLDKDEGVTGVRDCRSGCSMFGSRIDMPGNAGLHNTVTLERKPGAARYAGTATTPSRPIRPSRPATMTTVSPIA